MKDKYLLFSICSYVPSILRGESVNLGFAYHVPSLKEIGFVNTSNYKRVMTFDDELTSETLQHLIRSLKYDFSLEYITEYEEEYLGFLDNSNLLQNKIYNYVNQLQFREIKAFPIDTTLEHAIRDIKDLYLYYDKKKKDRIDTIRVKSLTKKLINMSELRSTLEIAPTINSFYHVPYDFKVLINGEETYIKSFTFDYSNANQLFKEMKSFFYDLQNSNFIDDWKSKNIQIVINNTDFSKQHEKLILESIPDSLKVSTLEEFSSQIKNNTSFQSLFN